MRLALQKRRRSLDAIRIPLALTRITPAHVLQRTLRAAGRVVGLVLCWGWLVGSPLQAQDDSMSRSERNAEKRRVKEAAKAEKKALKAFEKNYKQRQEQHYKNQQTSREKNLIAPGEGSARTEKRNAGHRKDNVRKRMRKGQQKARRHRDGRTVSWWRRLSVRRSWKKH